MYLCGLILQGNIERKAQENEFFNNPKYISYGKRKEHY
jgi:hypothetical protein